MALDRTSDDPHCAALLEQWRELGQALVRQHHDELDELLAPIEGLIRCRRFASAASAVQVAATHAVLWHPGTFAHGRMDRLVHEIGKAALDWPAAPRPSSGSPMRVVHVATQVGQIGGHTRMMRRWIANDSGNRHSVALTRQIDVPPDDLRATVAAAGGEIVQVNARVGGLLAWARGLQPIMSSADLCVLHVHNQDIIPFLALAGMRHRPRVILLNHADHLLWLGASVVDGVVNTRRSGLVLSGTRRRIPDARNLLMPLCLEPARRTMAVSEAKRALRLPDGSIVILTVARAAKFRAMGGQSFADALVPALKADDRLHLVAVGPGGTEDWSAAEAAVPGRIHAAPECPDPRSFFEAADIYLDSFPFPSITSLIEAGLYGLPILTRSAFGRGCEIMEADSVGIDEVLMRADSVEDLAGRLVLLASDPDLRRRQGDKTRAAIEAVNMGFGWRSALADVYAQVLRLPLRVPDFAGPEAPEFHDADLFLPFVFGPMGGTADAARRLSLSRELGIRTMPPVERLRVWRAMRRRQAFLLRPNAQAWRNLLPEWVTVKMRMPGRRPSTSRSCP